MNFITSGIKTVCAWCRQHLAGNPAAGKISHGICADCLQRQLDSVNRPLEDDNVFDTVWGQFDLGGEAGGA